MQRIAKKVIQGYPELFQIVFLSILTAFCLRPAVDLLIGSIIPGKIEMVILIITFIPASAALSFYLRKDDAENADVSVYGTPEGIDLVRVVAVILVMAVHYFINMGYYEQDAVGLIYFVNTVFRWLAQCCCPLFMVISGYLLNNREFNRKHILGLVRIIVKYAIIACIHILYVHFSAGVEITSDYLRGLVNMDIPWYLNMYFGLYLLIPFLNIIWHNINDDKKAVFLIVLVLLCSFSTVTYRWWTDYWFGLYPLMYYFFGCRMKEKGSNLTAFKGIPCLIGLISVQSLYTFYSGLGHKFDWGLNFGGFSSGYNAFPTLLATILVFTLFFRVNIRSKAIKKGLRIIARNSLEAYLLITMAAGPVIEHFVWSHFLGTVGVTGCFFIIAPAEIIVSVIFGEILNRLIPPFAGNTITAR